MSFSHYTDSLSQQIFELGSDGLQREFLGHKVSIGTAKMAHQDHRLGAMIQAVLDGGNGGLDPENHQAQGFDSVPLTPSTFNL